ncbi:hypothetical protein KAJ87_03645 [Candidatus Pacearchaeota archaeon]|nr:hypothetical protein [Candidatus Pacearchaeota archaeon]
MRFLKIIELVFGIIIFLVGLINMINLIGIFQIFGFGSAYISGGGFQPLWIYSLGFIAGGIAFIWDSFNKKSKFNLGIKKNKKSKINKNKSQQNLKNNKDF